MLRRFLTNPQGEIDRARALYRMACKELCEVPESEDSLLQRTLQRWRLARMNLCQAINNEQQTESSQERATT